MSLPLKSRIAIINAVAAAFVTLLVFLIVFTVVYYTAYDHLDSEILSEKGEVILYCDTSGDTLAINFSPELEEQEHLQTEISPKFLQVTNAEGKTLFRSSNMKNNSLTGLKEYTAATFVNGTINQKPVREGFFPLFSKNGNYLGSIRIAIPQEETTLILKNLKTTLCLAFPVMLLVFYFATYWAAGRGIKQVHQLIRFAEKISDRNISGRIPLPGNKDEIYQLTGTINELLQRIEVSLNREKQITADISHQLKTPVTGIRGNLEVLIRKPREPEVYDAKIRDVIRDIDSMSNTIEQLLQLSRLDSGNFTVKTTQINLAEMIARIWERSLHLKQTKGFALYVDIPMETGVIADPDLLSILLENLVSNAVKYGEPGNRIEFSWDAKQNCLSVTDYGQGIAENQLPFIFDRFYRTDVSRSSRVQGNGLGLAIVKMLADLMEINIEVQSTVNRGTTFRLFFMKIFLSKS